MKASMRKIKYLIGRNSYLINGMPVKKKRVNLESWDAVVNIGDQLSKYIVKWMLSRKRYRLDQKTGRTSFLLAVGSIIGVGYGPSNATIWGSGIHMSSSIYRIGVMRKLVRYDVRAVRGPLTRRVLEEFGYDCRNCVYGDPGVLMPFLYSPGTDQKKYEVSIIKHHLTVSEKDESQSDYNKYPYHFISVNTADYKHFIDEIAASKKIISSSLHGIILAETYGVPAVFLNENGSMDKQIMKYYDWYYSTDRRSVICADTIEEAIELDPMPLPDLDLMRKQLIDSFPYDLWEL